MKIFIICTVRNATEEYKQKLEAYVKSLEDQGHTVHLPHRDTDQTKRGLDICHINTKAIANSNEVHVFYNPESQGTHFDMGVAFAYGRKIVVVENTPYDVNQKSFAKMLDEWAFLFKNNIEE